jgi:hypothetical protein
MSIINAEKSNSITEIEFSDVRILHRVSPALHSGGAISHL